MQVIDRSGSLSGAFSDLSKVEKYEISDNAYEKRAGKMYPPSDCVKKLLYLILII